MMFGRKKQLPPRIEAIDQGPSLFETIDCTDCGCLVLNCRARTVERRDLPTFLNSSPYVNRYCGRCKPPYDRVTASGRYERREPERWVPVTKDGKEIEEKDTKEAL